MIEFIREHFQWVFSGIGTTVVFTYILVRGSNVKSGNTNDNASKETDSIVIAAQPELDELINEDYKTILGQRLKLLRENILKLSIREFAEFYEFETVSELEQYEKGEKELPLEKLRMLEKFFFIEPKYLELGEVPIFSTFYLSRDNVSKYLDDGFTPIIACCPYARENLFCMILFYKEQEGICRIIVSDRDGSFSSSGGGKTNIQNLIYEMIDRKMDMYEVSILTTSEIEWKQLEEGSYYDKRLFSRPGSVDNECMDVFDKWYTEAKKLKSN